MQLIDNTISGKLPGDPNQHVKNRVHRFLEDRFGRNSQIVWMTNVPKRYNWSFAYHLTVSANGDHPRAIRIKIPKCKKAKTLAAVIKHGEQPCTRMEYNLMQRIERMLLEDQPQGLTAVRTLGYIPYINAIVSEELPSITFKQYLLRPAVARWLSIGQFRTIRFMKLAGKWLRYFHDQMGHAEGEYYDFNILLEEVDALCSQLEIRRAIPAAVANTLLGSVENLRHRKIPHGWIHGDINLGNLLVTPEGQIAGLDMKMARGTFYEDLARLIQSPVISGIGLTTRTWLYSMRRRRAWLAAMLEGYGPDRIDFEVLRDFMTIAVLSRWVEVESRLTGANPLKGQLAGLLLKPIRRFYCQELQRLLSGDLLGPFLTRKF